MKKVLLAAMVFMAFLFSGCNAPSELSYAPPSAATSTPASESAPIESQIAAFADADVMEEDGQLVIAIRVEGDTMEAVCGSFFDQAEIIYANCIARSEYTGVSFSLLQNELVVGSVFILPDEGGMKVYSPVVLDSAYSTAFLNAFYDSDFAKSLAD
jgi:hypothetical protein